MKTQNPKDPGSLNVGSNPLNVVKGQEIRIKGEDRNRKVTYVMGTPEKGNVHLCMKGTGPVPLGEIEYEVVGAEVKVTKKSA
jgi:hypothetical protein